MIRNQKVSTVLASTALMILRNRLSEQIWGDYGVNTFPDADPLPRRDVSMKTIQGPHRSPRRAGPLRISREGPSFDRPRDRSEGIGSVGVIGDSISDEYRFYAPDRVTARNWVEILSVLRGLDFGAHSVMTLDGARDRRFAYNWSKSGSTTSGLIAQGQHRGLAAQVAAVPIRLAAVSVGTNDFADVMFTTRSVDAMGPALDRALSNLDEILGSLLDLNPTLKIAAFTAVDLRSSPLIRGILDSGLVSTAMARAYRDAVASFNDRLRDLASAHAHRIVVVDVDGLLSEIVEADRYPVGSVDLERLRAGNGIRHLFLRDGFHPGTLGQCLMANRFLNAVNQGFGSNIPTLRGEEMVDLASAVPRPSSPMIVRSGVLALFGYGRRRRLHAARDLWSEVGTGTERISL